MAVPVVSFPIYLVVRILGIAITAVVLTWTIHYRGGLALISDNKDLIFNVIAPVLYLFTIPFGFPTNPICLSPSILQLFFYLHLRIQELIFFSFYLFLLLFGALRCFSIEFIISEKDCLDYFFVQFVYSVFLLSFSGSSSFDGDWSCTYKW